MFFFGREEAQKTGLSIHAKTTIRYVFLPKLAVQSTQRLTGPAHRATSGLNSKQRHPARPELYIISDLAYMVQRVTLGKVAMSIILQ